MSTTQKNPGVTDSGVKEISASHRSIPTPHDMGSDTGGATLAERAAEAKRRYGNDRDYPDFWLHMSGIGADSVYQFFPDGDAAAHREARRRAAAPGGGGLVNITNKCGQGASSQVSAAALRSSRYAARTVLHAVSTLPRVRACGRVGIRPAGTVDVLLSADGSTASFSGLGVCGSLWACPTCSARIQATRRDELARLQAWAEDREFTVVFGTATLRHTKGQSLAELWGGATDRLVPGRKTMSEVERAGVMTIRDAQARRGVPDDQLPKLRPVRRNIKPRGLVKCFNSVRENRRVRRLRAAMGFVGYVRVVEATYGDNGWHPHIHVLYVFNRAVSDAEIDALADAEFAAWAAGAKVSGLGAPLRERYELTRAAGPIDSYFTKTVYYERSMSVDKVGQELASAITKKGKAGGRTPFQILADYVADRKPEDLALWTEWERTSYGRRAMTWSRGLKAMAGIDDVTDEDIAGSDDEDAVALFAIADWVRDVARRGNAGELADGLLRSVEKGGKSAGLNYCEHHRIETYPMTHEVVIWDRMAVADQRAQRSVEHEPSDVVAARAALRQEHIASDAVIDVATAVEWFEFVSDRGDEGAIPEAVKGVKDALGALRRANARLERMDPEKAAARRVRASCTGLVDHAVTTIAFAAQHAAHEAIRNRDDTSVAPTVAEGRSIARTAALAADTAAFVLTRA